VVKKGAVVKYAILGENSQVGANATVGGAPEDSDPTAWGITILGPGCVIADDEVVAPKTMLNRDHKEVCR